MISEGRLSSEAMTEGKSKVMFDADANTVSSESQASGGGRACELADMMPMQSRYCTVTIVHDHDHDHDLANSTAQILHIKLCYKYNQKAS